MGTNPAATPGSAPASAPIIRVEGLAKRFGTSIAVDHVDLAIERGELFALLGASGCGKTTLLRLLAGLERPDGGRILIDGEDMTEVPAYRRPVNMVFQSYALFPHMSVERNVAFGLRQDGLPRAEIRARVAEALDLVRMGDFTHRRPHELSGGQRQRVALCRALVKHPKILLLDEPLAALDRRLRESMRLELVAIQKRVGITFVMVTHDQEEAMSLSSRIAVMRDGRILQVDTPRRIYEYPINRFVAEFVGDANLFDVTVTTGANGAPRARSADGEFTIPAADRWTAGARLTLMVRPEKIALGRQPAGEGRDSVAGVVEAITYLGDLSVYHVRLASGGSLRVAAANQRHAADEPIAGGEAVVASWTPASAVVIGR